MLDALRRMIAVSQPRTLGSVTVGHGVNEFFAIVIPPIIPLLVSDLGVTYGQAGFLLTIFFIMYSIFQLPAGIVADRLGKNRVMIIGLVGMAFGVLIASAATSYEMLLIAQIIAGTSGSTFHPTGMSIISDAETQNTEGRAMGVFGFGGALGTMASPLIVGTLAVIYDWRIALAGAALAGILALIVCFSFLYLSDKTHSKQTNGGQSISIREQIASLRAFSNVSAGYGVIILFLITMFLSAQHRAIQTYTTSYVTAETGTAVSVGNLTFFTLLLGGSLASLSAGDLADKFSRSILGMSTAIATSVFVGATLLIVQLLGVLPTGGVIAVLSVWFAVIGAMMYASYPVKNAMVSEISTEEYSGSLFGVIQTASAVGSASGPAVFGVLATWWGIDAAFPAIALIGFILFLLFALMRHLE